jgi:hypothetical protein
LRKPVVFGIDYYNPPKMEMNLVPARSNLISKQKLKNFADIEAKNKSFIPAPTAYNTTYDW